ncbi:MAG: tetratricopeptide repeat protein, partial [Saprospiraceae bacterium]|nr:tetratricopeptide repeat protein [Saprospiraceae bacterium]
MFKTPEFFFEERLCVEIPRTQVMCSEKTWKNTVALWRELRSFAVAGELHIWVLDENNAMIHAETLVPQGDKMATTEYLRGVEMLKKGGNEEKAIEYFNRAIEKYENYWQAYERRGQANLLLHRLEDAILDFQKSINLYKNPYAYLGLGRVKFEMTEFDIAVDYFQMAIDNAVPYQPVFWIG